MEVWILNFGVCCVDLVSVGTSILPGAHFDVLVFGLSFGFAVLIYFLGFFFEVNFTMVCNYSCVLSDLWTIHFRVLFCEFGRDVGYLVLWVYSCGGLLYRLFIVVFRSFCGLRVYLDLVMGLRETAWYLGIPILCFYVVVSDF